MASFAISRQQAKRSSLKGPEFDLAGPTCYGRPVLGKEESALVLIRRSGWLLLTLLLIFVISTSVYHSADMPRAEFTSAVSGEVTQTSAASALEHQLFSPARSLRPESVSSVEEDDLPVPYLLLLQWGLALVGFFLAGREINWGIQLYFQLCAFRLLNYLTARDWHPRHLQFHFTHSSLH